MRHWMRRNTVTRPFHTLEKSVQYLTAELEKLGIKVYPGEADFLLIKTDDPLYEKLLKKKILIRDCSNYRGLSKGYYRIAVKTHEENEKLIAQLKDTI